MIIFYQHYSIRWSFKFENRGRHENYRSLDCKKKRMKKEIEVQIRINKAVTHVDTTKSVVIGAVSLLLVHFGY